MTHAVPEGVPASVPPAPAGRTPGVVHTLTVTGADGDRVVDVAAGERILTAARRAGVWLPYECGWGSCGTCKSTLVDGEVSLLFPEAPAIDARDERRRRILLCQCTAASDVVVKPLRVSDAPAPERPTRDAVATLTSVEALSRSVSRFRFALGDADGAPVAATYRPGQYAILDLGDGLRRCYSMAGLPGDSHVEFIAKHYVGKPGSGALFCLRVGTTVPVELPYGDMWLRDDDAPVVLVAGGTGVSAILALIRQLASAGPRADQVTVVYGAVTRQELVCWDELLHLADRIPGAVVHGALQDPPPAWTGTRGLVTDALPQVLADHADTAPRVYLAGPPAMVRAVEAVLNGAGHPKDRRHVDAFG